MDLRNSKSNFVLFGLVVFLTVGVFFYKSLAKEIVPAESSIRLAESPFKGSDQFVSGEYRNGLYTASGNYVSPGGAEEIEISLVLERDAIKDIQLTKRAKLPTSQFFQGKFAAGYKELVVGKNINEIKLDKVAGSSLTSKGFNEALEKIKLQARS